jgi:hypothetical protein
MSDILSIQTPYVDGDTVTSTNLNDLVKKATFTSAVVDGSTTQLSSGAIIVRDGGITTNKLVDGSVTELKLSTATQAKLLKGLEIEASGEAIIGGTKAGNTRGAFALDIQNKQSSALATVVASGDGAVALGYQNTAIGDFSTCVGSSNSATFGTSSVFGYNNTSSGEFTTCVGSSNRTLTTSGSAFGTLNEATGTNVSAIGYSNEADGTNSSAIGYNNLSNGSNSSALGYNNTANGENSSAIGSNILVNGNGSHAFGYNVATSSANSAEFGLWSSNTVRKSGVKLTFNGGVALTCENTSSAPSDQATAGAEDSAELGRSMFTIQRNGDAFTLYFNDAGTIKSLSLGSVS